MSTLSESDGLSRFMLSAESHALPAVLITGAARRIGATIARVLHQKSMNILLHYHHSAVEAEALCHELNEKRPDSAVLLSADLRQSQALPNLIERALQPWGRLDGLVNNASCFYPTLIETCDEKQWADLMDTNLKAPFFLSRLAAPALAKQGGSIVNITDIHAQQPMRHYAIYCMSKAGLEAATKILAKELAPKIRVNAVAPGPILWPDQPENQLDAVFQEKIITRTALKRAGQPTDVANAVWFLLSEACYVTGQTLGVEGGRTLFCY